MKDTIDRKDIDRLIKWLKTYPRLTKGNLTVEFEEMWSEWLGCRYSTFVNSGSSANLLMVYAWYNDYVRRNDVVVVPAVSWATTVSPLIQFGLKPILCDCCEYNLGLDLHDLQRIFEEHQPSALIMANILGFPNDMDEIKLLCDRYNVVLLEDSCETVGSTYKGTKTGRFGEMSTFSFYFGHHISTIEGGMICTDDQNLDCMLKMLRSHGWDRDLSLEDKARVRMGNGFSDFEALYKFYVPGFNLRSTDLQAYIGIGQMEKLNRINAQRYQNFLIYDQAIKNDYWKVKKTGETVSNFAYPIIHPYRDEIVKVLMENGIECRPLVCGSMKYQPFLYVREGEYNNLKFAEKVDNFGMYVPNHPDLTCEEILKICDLINGVICE